ncbi:Zinc finger and BTB domain-containing protein 14 [Araneus ventricosus]|uniref:Zinc finger and BTB domain-containing protein 14 n=1 Tax=Araneus ventricosus TaxID=182803 RepID=A0A4Y2TQW3_ARAVE|nr:Zinc finger and BTB domain-containing protein 14 [Araneus ventricosus]
MLGRQETSSQIGKSSGSGIGVPLQVRSQMRVGVICVINDDVALVSLYSLLTIDQQRVSSMDQRRVSFSSVDSDQGEFDDFATPACNDAMNAAELQSEWKIDTPVWDEAPSTSSGQRGLASPEKHVDQGRVYSMDSDQGEVCPTCSKSFPWKKSLVMHMKIHTGKKLFTYEICQISFGRNDSLKRHTKPHASEIEENENYLKCDICDKTFRLKDNLKDHMKTHSKENNFKCNICDRSFQRKHCFAMHMRKHQEKNHPEIKLTSVKRGTASTTEGNSKRVRRDGGALNTFTSTFFQPTENSKKDFLLFFDEITPQLEEKTEEEIREKGAVKWYGVVKAVFKRESEDGGKEERVTPYFRSNVQIELVGDTVGDHVPASFTNILEAVDEFIRRSSGWILDKIVHFELCVAKYQPPRASSYIILPKKLADKKAVLNIQNEDQKCLVWCLIAHK